jgi:hypothetical protein
MIASTGHNILPLEHAAYIASWHDACAEKWNHNKIKATLDLSFSWGAMEERALVGGYVFMYVAVCRVVLWLEFW